MKRYAKTPTILQMEATECGAASLAMVMAYHGRYIPLEQMRVETAVSRDGVNAADLIRAAKRFGMDCHGYRKEPDALREMPMPCIIHWNFNHFVVLEGFKGKYAYLNDPAIGRRRITQEELDESFTGVVLTFATTDAFVREKQQSRVMPFIRQRLRGQWSVIVKLVFIGLLMVAPGLILPVLSQVFIDSVLVAGYRDWLVRLLVFMGGCVVVRGTLAFYRSVLLAKLQSKLTLISGYRFLSHLFRLPITFFDQRYAGDLVDRMTGNDSVNEFLAGSLAETLLSILTALFYLVVLLFYSPILTLIGLCGVAVSLGVTLLAGRTAAGVAMKQRMAGGKLYGAICAGLSITDTIKASGVEQEYANRLIGYQAVSASEDQKLNRFQQVVGAVPEVTSRLCDVLMLMVGAVLVIHGQFTTGMLVGFTSLFDSFSAPVNQVASFFSSVQTLRSNISRVDDIERYPQDAVDPSMIYREMEGRKLSGQVELADVTFGYAQQKAPTVANFSFRLRSGESIAFVGASGCGKSTISKVISGLYRPWAGYVLLDGVPISQIPPAVLHASVATVSQKITLFSGTIRDNITMWNSAIPDADMIAAAQDACIHDFIMQQPGGYDYQLTEDAQNISGGQRQRLEIARALAINPTILIMDEATSALDPLVEKQIMNNLQKRGCTCIIVAHRLSAIRDCNEIVVMDHGQIIQRGTHESLKNEDGFYRRFIQDT